ncbi:UNVERIFIED_CONTAM: hypothetical protein RF648_19250, partial [Kocuria sp. CPCC 205274]
MCGIKLKDWALQAQIFEHIKTFVPDLYLFIDMEPEQWNQLLIMAHGKRTVYEPVINGDPATVTIWLLTTYAEKWLQLPELNKQIKIGYSGNKVKTDITETTGKKDSVSQVAAFNSDQLITDGAGTATDKSEVIRTITDSAFDVNAVFNSLTVLEKSSIINTVLS